MRSGSRQKPRPVQKPRASQRETLAEVAGGALQREPVARALDELERAAARAGEALLLEAAAERRVERVLRAADRRAPEP